MKISVILTSYNHEKYIRQSIESVLNQTYRNFEFIIVDDCSTDSSWNVICEYQEKYPSIITIRHDYNWHGGTVEDIVKNVATGDYIALHHSDDVWELDKLEKQVSAMNEHPECVAIFTNARAIAEDGSLYQDRAGFYYNLFQTKNRSRQEWLNYFFYKGNCLCHPSILVKKEVYAADGFFRKGLRQIPDFVKWIQICKEYEIYVLPEELVNFRIHVNGGNASGFRADTQIRSTVELFLMLDEYAQIDDRDEFVKIFPEAEEFCRKDAFFQEYAFGRVCMQTGLQPYIRLYGMQQIYRLLNEPEKAMIVKEVYGYTMQQFMDETGKQDIFGLLPEAVEQVRTLYWDMGQGYSTEHTREEKFFLNQEEEFKMKCELDVRAGEEIVSMRFDPAEGIMSCCRIDRVLVNGQEVPCWAENAVLEIDETQFFAIEDPIYRIEYAEIITNDTKLIVEICGKIERTSQEKVSDMIMEKICGKQFQVGEPVQKRTVYVDRGDGYSVEDCITNKYYMENSLKYAMECTITADAEKPVVGLRFDPTEGVIIKSKINRIVINGLEAEWQADNRYSQYDDWDFFLTLDPVYTILIPNNLVQGVNIHVVIEGEIAKCTQQEITDGVAKAKSQETQTCQEADELKKAEILKDVYGYTMQQFRTLYLNTGEGYSTEHALQEKFILNQEEEFEMKCELDVKAGEEIVSMRFDPVEGIMSCCRIDRVLVNGREVSCWAENAALEIGGTQFFAIEDPIYQIGYAEKIIKDAKLTVEVCGKIERVSQERASEIIMEKIYKKQFPVGELVQTRTLYVDRGDGYSAEDCIMNKYYMENHLRYAMECMITVDAEKPVVGLRFDPIEGLIIKSKIDRIVINGLEMEWQADNRYRQYDNWDFFLTLDPIYTIVISNNLKEDVNMYVTIEGEIATCTQQEIADCALGKNEQQIEINSKR